MPFPVLEAPTGNPRGENGENVSVFSEPEKGQKSGPNLVFFSQELRETLFLAAATPPGAARA